MIFKLPCMKKKGRKTVTGRNSNKNTIWLLEASGIGQISSSCQLNLKTEDYQLKKMNDRRQQKIEDTSLEKYVK